MEFKPCNSNDPDRYFQCILYEKYNDITKYPSLMPAIDPKYYQKIYDSIDQTINTTYMKYPLIAMFFSMNEIIQLYLKYWNPSVGETPVKPDVKYDNFILCVDNYIGFTYAENSNDYFEVLDSLGYVTFYILIYLFEETDYFDESPTLKLETYEDYVDIIRKALLFQADIFQIPDPEQYIISYLEFFDALIDPNGCFYKSFNNPCQIVTKNDIKYWQCDRSILPDYCNDLDPPDYCLDIIENPDNIDSPDNPDNTDNTDNNLWIYIFLIILIIIIIILILYFVKQGNKSKNKK